MNDLSPDSKVWIYAADRLINENEAAEIKAQINNFTNEWSAHGAHLKASGSLFESRFIVFFVDETNVSISGCSIDSSVAFIKSIEAKFKIDFFNRTIVHFIQDGQVVQDSIHEFWAKRKANLVNEDTIVYDNLVKTKADFETKWKVPFKESWHQEMWN